MIRKYCEINELNIMENNEAYNNWINSFNWKKSNPYQPNKFIL